MSKYDLYTMTVCPDRGDLLSKDQISKVREIGLKYANNSQAPHDKENIQHIQKYWNLFIEITSSVSPQDGLSEDDIKNDDLKGDVINKDNIRHVAEIALSLFIIADEACSGIGFRLKFETGKEKFTWIQVIHYLLSFADSNKKDLDAQHRNNWFETLVQNYIDQDNINLVVANDISSTCIFGSPEYGLCASKNKSSSSRMHPAIIKS